jgi:hypothetical protein
MRADRNPLSPSFLIDAEPCSQVQNQLQEQVENIIPISYEV